MKRVDNLEEKLGDILADPKFVRLNEVISENEKLEYQKKHLEKVGAFFYTSSNFRLLKVQIVV